MTIAVRERTAEIGLLRAIGATRARIAQLFLGEAVLLSGFGGGVGLLVGIGIIGLVAVAVPTLPADLSPLYIGLAELIALLIGLGAGVLPARHAAQLEPLDALRAE
jgi:putative ABC transport system permease protein